MDPGLGKGHQPELASASKTPRKIRQKQATLDEADVLRPGCAEFEALATKEKKRHNTRYASLKKQREAQTPMHLHTQKILEDAWASDLQNPANNRREKRANTAHTEPIQGYLTHKKTPSPRTLPKAFA